MASAEVAAASQAGGPGAAAPAAAAAGNGRNEEISLQIFHRDATSLTLLVEPSFVDEHREALGPDPQKWLSKAPELVRTAVPEQHPAVRLFFSAVSGNLVAAQFGLWGYDAVSATKMLHLHAADWVATYGGDRRATGDPRRHQRLAARQRTNVLQDPLCNAAYVSAPAFETQHTDSNGGRSENRPTLYALLVRIAEADAATVEQRAAIRAVVADYLANDIQHSKIFAYLGQILGYKLLDELIRSLEQDPVDEKERGPAGQKSDPRREPGARGGAAGPRAAAGAGDGAAVAQVLVRQVRAFPITNSPVPAAPAAALVEPTTVDLFAWTAPVVPAGRPQSMFSVVRRVDMTSFQVRMHRARADAPPSLQGYASAPARFVTGPAQIVFGGAALPSEAAAGEKMEDDAGGAAGGGASGSPANVALLTNAVWSMDVATRAWACVKAAAASDEAPAPRHSHAANVFPSGPGPLGADLVQYLIVFGGVGAHAPRGADPVDGHFFALPRESLHILADLWLFDVHAGRWLEVDLGPSPPSARFGAQLLAVERGEFVVVGGEGPVSPDQVRVKEGLAPEDKLTDDGGDGGDGGGAGGETGGEEAGGGGYGPAAGGSAAGGSASGSPHALPPVPRSLPTRLLNDTFLLRLSDGEPDECAAPELGQQPQRPVAVACVAGADAAPFCAHYGGAVFTAFTREEDGDGGVPSRDQVRWALGAGAACAPAAPPAASRRPSRRAGATAEAAAAEAAAAEAWRPHTVLILVGGVCSDLGRAGDGGPETGSRDRDGAGPGSRTRSESASLLFGLFERTADSFRLAWHKLDNIYRTRGKEEFIFSPRRGCAVCGFQTVAEPLNTVRRRAKLRQQMLLPGPSNENCAPAPLGAGGWGDDEANFGPDDEGDGGVATCLLVYGGVARLAKNWYTAAQGPPLWILRLSASNPAFFECLRARPTGPGRADLVRSVVDWSDSVRGFQPYIAQVPAAVTPNFLWTLASLQRSPLTAVAHFVDNAMAAGATGVEINIGPWCGQQAVTISDSGVGLGHAGLLALLRRFGGAREHLEASTRHVFGVGFKLGVAALAHNALVLSRSHWTWSAGLLAAPFSAAACATSLVAPVVSWSTADGNPVCHPVEEGDFAQSAGCIVRNSPLGSMAALEEEFRNAFADRDTGTRIVLFGLREDLPFVRVKHDGTASVVPFAERRLLPPPTRASCTGMPETLPVKQRVAGKMATGGADRDAANGTGAGSDPAAEIAQTARLQPHPLHPYAPSSIFPLWDDAERSLDYDLGTYLFWSQLHQKAAVQLNGTRLRPLDSSDGAAEAPAAEAAAAQKLLAVGAALAEQDIYRDSLYRYLQRRLYYSLEMPYLFAPKYGDEKCYGLVGFLNPHLDRDFPAAGAAAGAAGGVCEAGVLLFHEGRLICRPALRSPLPKSCFRRGATYARAGSGGIPGPVPIDAPVLTDFVLTAVINVPSFLTPRATKEEFLLDGDATFFGGFLDQLEAELREYLAAYSDPARLAALQDRYVREFDAYRAGAWQRQRLLRRARGADGERATAPPLENAAPSGGGGTSESSGESGAEEGRTLQSGPAAGSGGSASSRQEADQVRLVARRGTARPPAKQKRPARNAARRASVTTDDDDADDGAGGGGGGDAAEDLPAPPASAAGPAAAEPPPGKRRRGAPPTTAPGP